jgi:two-component system, cell cycle response regulator
MSTPPSHDKAPRRIWSSLHEDDLTTQAGQVDSTVIKAKSRRDRPYLIVLAGENLGQMFRIEQPEIVLGRSSEASFRLPDDGVSRLHAKVTQTADEVWIEDLKSINGTLINGLRIGRVLLRDGDKIQMGSTTILKFTYSDELEEDYQLKMYDAALHDGLTKAYNKRYFLDRLPTETAYAVRHAAPLSLLMIDVDHFKTVNDSYGHPAGDFVLSRLAQLVAAALRTEDLFVRYGGEEFAILCRGVKLENATVLAKRLRALIEASVFEYQGKPIPITISIGVASCARTSDPGGKLVADADAALYEAKRAGRNQVISRASGTEI